MLDARSEMAIRRITDSVCAALGPDLVSLLLYGSAAGEDFVRGRSDLNYAIVVGRITAAHLRVVQRHLPEWHKLGMAMPLLLDREFLKHACDVFPMELLDMQAQHRVLHGKDVIAPLRVDARHLRYQAEHEARSKLLRLRVLYAEVGANSSQLHELLLSSVKTFAVIMRNFLRLRGAAAPSGYAGVIEAFRHAFGIDLPTMQRLVRIRSGQDSWDRDGETLFSAYLEEVERLVQLVDQIPPDMLVPVSPSP
jgi:hypothetical protein